MAAKCDSCGVNDATRGTLCADCARATDRLIADVRKGGKK